MTYRSLTAAAAIAAVTALAGCGVSDPLNTTSTRPTVVTVTRAVAPPAPAPPKLSPDQINKQDRFTAAEKRAQSHAMDSRPLLDHLPYVQDGVTVDIAGLAADNKTTILSVTTRTRTKQQAAATYQQILKRFKDPGTAYKVRYYR